MDYRSVAALFDDPPAAYRPMLFWLWNGDLTREGIADQVAEFASRGAGGFFIHPMGENFRLGDFIQGMNPPYLSDEYFALVRYAAECARAHGLYLWLYDEGGWPSGTAQGKVTEGHPELRGKRLHAHRVHCGESIPHFDDFVAAVGLPEMGVPVPLDPRELAQGLCPYQEVLIFNTQPDGFAIDVLNTEAVRRFMALTHERYAATVGDFFGNTIPGIFTDETPLGGRAGADAVPWTGDLLPALDARMGRDARTYLPLLFDLQTVGTHVLDRYSEHEILAARCDYYDCVTECFSQAFWQQITRWCEGHGLIHTGHVGGEDNLPDHLVFGHFFRTAGELHAPGVDAIWRQLFPGEGNFPFPRLAASAAKRRAGETPAPRGRQWENLAITETNAVYGGGLNYWQARWVADYHFQSGINLYGQMAWYYTTQGGRLYGTMSHFGRGNPLWPFYRGFADYIGRMSVLVRQSQERAAVALYYPAEALWTVEGVPEAWETLREAALALTELQVGFDFIDADLLARMSGDPAGLEQDLSYSVIIVPASLAMSARALEDLAELAEAGGRVLFLEHWPVQPAEMQGLEQFLRALERLQQAQVTPVQPDDLEEELAGLKLQDRWLRLLDPEAKLLMSARLLDDGRVYLLTNDSDKTMEPFLAFKPDQAAVLEARDLRDGERAALSGADPAHPTEVSLILPPWSTQALVARPLAQGEELPEVGEPRIEGHDLVRWLADPSHRRGRVPHADVLAEFDVAELARVRRQYRIVEGDVVEVADEDLPTPHAGLPVPLRLWEEWPLWDFSGEVEYVFRFPVAEELAGEPLLLDLGQVFWAARVMLNGEVLGESLWPPHIFDVTRMVQAGDNELRVTVANTLANELTREGVVEEARERGWFNAYYQRALPMMQEDLRGGLVGPVRFIVAKVRR